MFIGIGIFDFSPDDPGQFEQLDFVAVRLRRKAERMLAGGKLSGGGREV